VRKLTRLVGDVAPDHQAKVTVLRNGDSRDVTVTLGKRPTPKFEEGAFAMGGPGRLIFPSTAPFPDSAPLPALPQMNGMPQIDSFPPMPGGDNFFVFRGFGGRQIGINISPLTKQLADHFGVAGGVLVNNVRENSPAEKAGLKAGDIITEIDGKEVKSDIDLVRAVGEKKTGDVELTFVRDQNRQTVRVTPEESKDVFRSFDIPDGVRLAPGERLLGAPQAPGAPAAPPAPRAFNLMIPGRVL
jgi:membrane-associated protease RseP (regulator of RpoE activity)